MIRVLCDAIHADLWESLRLLFEVRLGWELYRPIGMEWQAAGIWKFEQHQDYGLGVAHQFLDHHGDDHPVISSTGGEWSVREDDTHPGERYRLVTMEQAADLRPDLVLATLAENELGWRQWADDHGAHYGIQTGNQGAANVWAAAEFGLLSVTTPDVKPWKPHVYYHQEFSRELFHPDGGALAEPDLVSTHVQCIAGSSEYPRIRRLVELVPDMRFRWFGHCGEPDELAAGNLSTTPEVAAAMHRARIAYHAKRWSDGYGHVIHNWFSIGRPVLATATYYQDKLAGPLFVEGVTSFDLERLTDGDVAGIIRMLLHDDDRWRRMCEASAERFAEVVSFEQEAEQIRAMLENVMSDRVHR